MTWIKRIFLFGLVNIAIMVMLSLVLRVTGLDLYLNQMAMQHGQNYSALLLYCLFWGMGGAFISLWMSKWMAKMAFGVEIIDPNSRDDQARELVATVHRLARSAGITGMPEVGVYNSPEVNAFATGPTKNNSLVAVSSGLLQRMNRSELEGVLGHEVAHIANGDMVTMTLIQGVVNAFVMFFARIFAKVASGALSRDSEGRGSAGLEFALVIAFQIVFGILGSIIVCAFSRWREFRADAGGARFAGRGNMIAALQALKRQVQLVDDSHEAYNTMKISGRSKWFALFSTHPDLDDRIAKLSGAGAR